MDVIISSLISPWGTAYLLAVKSKAKFLITYNWRHFKKEKIKNEFGILILTPAIFLQYLRSRGNFI